MARHMGVDAYNGNRIFTDGIRRGGDKASLWRRGVDGDVLIDNIFVCIHNSGSAIDIEGEIFDRGYTEGLRQDRRRQIYESRLRDSEERHYILFEAQVPDAC